MSLHRDPLFTGNGQSPMTSTSTIWGTFPGEEMLARIVAMLTGLIDPSIGITALVPPIVLVLVIDSRDWGGVDFGGAERVPARDEIRC